MKTTARHFAVIGAGIAGIACARTLVQAGQHVTLFEKNPMVGGRMATHDTEFGGFDHGAQYFTVRDPRFERVLRDTTATSPSTVRPWSANTVRVLDELGHVLDTAPPPREPHFVAAPGMGALAAQWARPLATQTLLDTRVTRIERDVLDGTRWQLRTAGPDNSQHVRGGFDGVLLALPSAPANDLLATSALAAGWRERLQAVTVAPCWTLMLAFPQAVQPGLTTLGPHWNAARSTHHRISWLARESSKPGRAPVERWTVQANPIWSAEHLEDDAERIKAKLIKGFSQITGIRAEPPHAEVHRWRQAQTQEPLGQPFLWNGELGLCGDWCLGHRVENGFISGLELALRVVSERA